MADFMERIVTQIITDVAVCTTQYCLKMAWKKYNKRKRRRKYVKKNTYAIAFAFGAGYAVVIILAMCAVIALIMR